MQPSVTQISFLFLLLHLWVTESGGERKKKSRFFVFKDCGLNLDRPIRFLNVTARPAPIRAPGKLKIWTAVNITRPLPETMGVDVSISKYFMGWPFKIPCINNFGTCHYNDVCSLLSQAMRERSCPRKLRKEGIPCRCPFEPNLYTLDSLRIRIPELNGILSMVAKGRYEAMVRVFDEEKTELGCAKVDFHMKHRRPKSRVTSGPLVRAHNNTR